MSQVEDLNKEAVALYKSVWKNTSLWEENFAKAIKILEDARKIDPNNITTLTNLGAACCDSGKHEEAKQYLEKAISLGSLDRNTYFNLGVACINTREDWRPYFDKARGLKESCETWEAYFDPHGH